MKFADMKEAWQCWWFRAGLLLVAGVLAAAFCTPYPAELVRALRSKHQPEVRIVEKRVEVPVEVRVEVPVSVSDGDNAALAAPEPWKPEALVPDTKVELPAFPPVLPEKLSTGTFEQFTALGRELHLRSTVNFAPGSTAAQDRKKRPAYQIRVSMELLVPHAADGRELLSANPDLTKVLLRYRDLMRSARVSRWFYAIYRHKQNHVRRAIASLTQPLDRHNYYDTDTILELEAPGTRRRVLWMQADMDVVSDGSDGDRLPSMPEAIRRSDNYQPTTSYRWKKRSTVPNPLLAGWEARLTKLQKEKPRRAAAIDNAKRVIWDIKRYSYLLAQYDPFIVVPLAMKEGRDDTYRPQPGDYAVVVVGKKVYPAIVGDFGPRDKAGEASLRLGKLINPKADVYARPVTSLGASYIIFPHSKEPEDGPINYERLNSRCRELLQELGGLGEAAEFVEIKDLLAPKPVEDENAKEKATLEPEAAKENARESDAQLTPSSDDSSSDESPVSTQQESSPKSSSPARADSPTGQPSTITTPPQP